MPQTTYLSLYAASYPILAKAQKPGGVTVLATVGAGDVPNKHVYAAGTIQMTSLDEEPQVEEQTEEEPPAEEPAE